MDADRFERLLRAFTQSPSRRGTFRFIAGSTLAALFIGEQRTLATRKGKHKKNKKKKSKGPRGVPPPLPCGSGGSCLVFVTSTDMDGGIGSLAQADTVCQNRAGTASLPGSYKAWLSDRDDSPSSRFVQSTGPYRLVSGEQIAANWTQLVTGPLSHPINKTEFGASPLGPEVWSNTQPNGTPAGRLDCERWNNDSGSLEGGVGNSNFADDRWTITGTTSCDDPDHLYCFQQS